MIILGYMAKLKRSLGLAFGAHFLHDFPINFSLFNIISMDKVSISHLISFSRYQTKCAIKFLVDDTINFKIYLGSTSKVMANRKKTRGRWNI